MTTRQASAETSKKRPADTKGRDIATAIVAAACALLVIAGFIFTIFPDRLTGEGRAVRKHMLANSEALAQDAIERAFARSEIDPADLAAMNSSAPGSFDLRRCSQNYRTRHRSVWKCEFALHVGRPFEVHITDTVTVHLKKTGPWLKFFTEEPEVISTDTGHHPKTVETFGVVPDADR